MCKKKVCEEKCREGMIVGKCLSILGEIMERRGAETKSGGREKLQSMSHYDRPP